MYNIVDNTYIKNTQISLENQKNIWIQMQGSNSILTNYSYYY